MNAGKITTAMILAAGRGERMRPLTDTLPKPMLKVKGKPLLQYHLESLQKAGVKKVIINHAWLGQEIVDYFAEGQSFGMDILYSAETQALETAGGIQQALPLLGEGPFILVNGDIFTDYDFSQLTPPVDCLAHLVLTENPAHHPQGDFAILQGMADSHRSPRCTYTGIGVYCREFFAQLKSGKFPLGPLIREWIEKKQVSAEYYSGHWCDVGTPQRLESLNSGG